MSDQSDTDAARGGRSDSADGDGAAGDAMLGDGLELPGSGSLSLRRVFDVLLVVALVLVVVPFAVYAAPSLVGADDSYVVRSGSMEPAIATGDVVIVERAAPAEIETGDVITFVPDGQPPPTTHRVVSKTEEDGVTRFTTKGDANAQADAEPVVESELVGKVTLVLPYVGYVVSFASTSAGFFALVAAPFGLLLATEVWSLFRADDDGADETDDADESAAPRVPSGSSPDADASEEGTYTLSSTDIRLSLAILLVLTGYSSLVAVSRPTPWSIAVAVAAFGTTVYLAAMRYTAATAATTGTPTPEPGSPLPPAREVEVTRLDGDRRGVGPVAAGDGPGANGTLGVSLAVSSATRPPEEPEPVGSEVAPEESDPADAVPGGDEAGDAGTATSTRRPSTDGADSADPEPGEASAWRATRRRLRASVAAAGGAAYRFLYTVGYLEVTAVRGVLGRIGLRSDGGES